MGTIIEIRPKSGKGPLPGVQIRKKRGGAIVVSKVQTFAREKAARDWDRTIEAELAKPGALDRAIAAAGAPMRPKLGDAIDRLVTESEREMKRTKAQVLRALRQDRISSMAREDLCSHHIVELAKRLFDGGRETSRVGNYISHLASVFIIGRPAWGYPLDRQAMEDAQTVCEARLYVDVASARPADAGRIRQAHDLFRRTVQAPPGS